MQHLEHWISVSYFNGLLPQTTTIHVSRIKHVLLAVAQSQTVPGALWYESCDVMSYMMNHLLHDESQDKSHNESSDESRDESHDQCDCLM